MKDSINYYLISNKYLNSKLLNIKYSLASVQ